MNRTTCPGCNGPKSKRAALCKTCRSRATRVGVDVVTHVPVADVVPVQPRTAVQNRIYHARLNDLMRLRRVTNKDARLLALDRAAAMLGRAIESSTELSEPEMERLLEWLQEQIEEAQLQAAATSTEQPRIRSL